MHHPEALADLDISAAVIASPSAWITPTVSCPRNFRVGVWEIGSIPWLWVGTSRVVVAPRHFGANV